MSEKSKFEQSLSFEFLWGEEDLADCIVLLRSSDFPNSELKRYRAHSALLGAQSDYFKSFFLRWYSKKASCDDKTEITDPKDGKKRKADSDKQKEILVEIEIQDDEVDAVDLIIKFFYFGYFENHLKLNIKLLMSVIKVAEKILASNCLKKAVADFLLVPKESIEHQDVLAYFESLPLTASQECMQVQNIFQECLLMRYSQIDEVIKSNEKRNEFMGLPLPAVSALLSSDKLGLSSENSVLVLAMWWAKEGRGKTYKTDQLQELSQCVRLCNLSPVFINQILPIVEWMEISPTQQTLLNHYLYSQNDSAKWPDYILKDACQTTSPPIPTSWIAKGRQNCEKAKSALVIFATISESNIDNFLKNPESEVGFEADDVYWRGYTWKPDLLISAIRCNAFVHCTVRIGDCHLLENGFQSFTVNLSIQNSEKKYLGSSWYHNLPDTYNGSKSFSTRLFERPEGVLEKKNWEPLLLNNKIVFEFEIRNCL